MRAFLGRVLSEARCRVAPDWIGFRSPVTYRVKQSDHPSMTPAR
jgi:hypothetical protein